MSTRWRAASYSLLTISIRPSTSPSEVSAWCEIWFRNRLNPTGGEHKKLNGLLDLAIERFKKIGEEDQNLFKGQLVSFRNLYSFVSQITESFFSSNQAVTTFSKVCSVSASLACLTSSRWTLGSMPKASSSRASTAFFRALASERSG